MNEILKEISSFKYKKIIPYFLYHRFNLENKDEEIFSFVNDKGGDYYLKFINIISPVERIVGKSVERNYKTNKKYVDISLDLTYGEGTIDDPFGWIDFCYSLQNSLNNQDEVPDFFLKGIRTIQGTDETYDCYIPCFAGENKEFYIRVFGWENIPYMIIIKDGINYQTKMFDTVSNPSEGIDGSIYCDGIILDYTTIPQSYYIPYLVNMAIYSRYPCTSISCSNNKLTTHPLYSYLSNTDRYYKSMFIIDNYPSYGGSCFPAYYGINTNILDCIIYIKEYDIYSREIDANTFINCIFNLDRLEFNPNKEAFFQNCLFNQDLENLPLIDFLSYTEIPEITPNLFDASLFYNSNWQGVNYSEYDLFKTIRDVEVGTGYFNKYQESHFNNFANVYITLKKSSKIYPFFIDIPINCISKQGDFFSIDNNVTCGNLKNKQIEFYQIFEPQSTLECKIRKDNISYSPKFVDVLFCGYFVER